MCTANEDERSPVALQMPTKYLFLSGDLNYENVIMYELLIVLRVRDYLVRIEQFYRAESTFKLIRILTRF